jgi:hypothetical protein
MRRTALIAGVLLVVAGAGADAAAARSCATAGDTVIKNSAVRLYDDAADRLYGCSLPSGRRVRLNAELGRWRLANVKGRYAAVVLEGAGSRRGVIMRAHFGPSSASRRVAYTFPRTENPQVSQLYVSRRGAIAFSAPSKISYIAPLEAHRKPSYSLLDSGPRVLSSSLWADERAGRLRWRSGDLRKSIPWR